MHALGRYLLPLLAATAIAPTLAHADDKPHASIVPNIAPNLGAQLEHPGAAPAAPAPAPVNRPVGPAGPAPVAPVPAQAKPAPTLPTGTPSFEVIDRGDTVEVIAHNIKAARTAVMPLRSRLQIAIAGAPVAKRATPGDKTVKLVELDSEDATRVLSVKLGFDYPETKALSRYAQAIQIGDDLHVLVPRKVPAEGASAKLPEPTLSPAAAAAMARADHTAMLGPAPNPNAPPPPPVQIKPEVKPEIKPEPKPAVAAVAPAPVETKPPAPVETKPPAPAAKIEPVEPDKPADKVLGPALDPHAKPPLPKLEAEDKPADKEHEEPVAHDAHARTDKLGRTLAPSTDNTWSAIAMYAALGLGAAGVGVWMLKRRSLRIPPNAEIDILAQRSLGGRARIVWLGAGDHELLVAVTPQAVNLLGQWPRGAAAASVPEDETFAGRMAHTMGPMSAYAAAGGPPVARPSQMMPIQRMRTGAMPAVTPPDDDGVVVEAAPDLRSAALRTARAAARKHADSLAAIDADPVPAPPPPARAVTTEYTDEEYADYEEQAAPPARASRPAIVLPPTPAEARIRRESQAARPQTHSDEADKPVSPAVNGILRLRGRTSQAPVVEPPREFAPDEDEDLVDDEGGGAKINDDVATADKEADQAWIKEMLAASGGTQ